MLSARSARVAAGLVAIVIAATVVLHWAAAPAAPDAFYEAPRAALATPGALLKSESFTRGAPSGARAWRILYATTRADDTPALASAIVMVADAPSRDPRPIIAWAHGTTGVAVGCAPSLMGRPFANVPALDSLIARGWAYVATDYVGLGTAGSHAYLNGEDAARSVLDAVRAAQRLSEINLDNRVAVWGHSQGGNSALWTGMRGGVYAPDVRLVGVAAFAPASDLKGLAHAAQATTFGAIVSAFLIAGYAAVSPDVKAEDYLKARTGALVADIQSRCVGEWPTLVSVIEAMMLPKDGIFARDPTTGALGARLAQNTPRERIPAPVLIAQGAADDLVLPKIQSDFVAQSCAAGQAIDYRTYPGRDHISLVAPGSPLEAELVQWTQDRFAGKPGPADCVRSF